MLRTFVKSQIDLPIYLIWFMLSALIVHLTTAVELNPFPEDEFAEFDDPDDTFTADSPNSLGSIKQGHGHSKPPDRKHKADDDDNRSKENLQTPHHHPSDGDDDVPLVKRKPLPLDPNTESKAASNDEAQVEIDETPNMELRDDEEFEGFSPSSRDGNSEIPAASKKKSSDLIVTKVPRHLTGSWDSYHLEMLIVSVLVIYLINFLVGRSKNAQLASAWFEAHQPLFESQFALVGDDGQAEAGSGAFVKESEHLYSLWCSGRASCDGMLVELRLVKRQCLIFQLAGLLQPVHDTIVAKVIMEDSEMDGWVMAVGRKRRLQALVKDHLDLSFFCADRRGQRHPGLPESFTVLSEIPEATTFMLNAPICKFLSDNEDSIDYMFFSDQYTGPKPPPEETPSAQLPVTQKVLIFSFRVGNKGTVSIEDMQRTTPLFNFIFYLIDKVRRFRLGKEFKLKSERNRQRAYEARLKSIHTLRQEAAQSRREERLRANKERILAEEDPDKARKLEEREQRREKAKKMPKMKMLKSRGM